MRKFEHSPNILWHFAAECFKFLKPQVTLLLMTESRESPVSSKWTSLSTPRSSGDRSYGGGQERRRALYKCLLFVHRQAERCQKPTCQVSSFQTSACNQYHGDPGLKQRQLTLQCLLMNLSGKMRIFACKHDVHIIQIEIVEIPVVHVPVVNLSKKWLWSL